MFTKNSEAMRLIRVNERENAELHIEISKLKAHVGKLTQQTEANTNYGKKNSKVITRLIEHTGADDGYIHFLSFGTSSTVREFKSFNLLEKVDALMAHLGLTESVTQGNKLIPAPKKKKEIK